MATFIVASPSTVSSVVVPRATAIGVVKHCGALVSVDGSCGLSQIKQIGQSAFLSLDPATAAIVRPGPSIPPMPRSGMSSSLGRRSLSLTTGPAGLAPHRLSRHLYGVTPGRAGR
jgi:hypothetical protein